MQGLEIRLRAFVENIKAHSWRSAIETINFAQNAMRFI